MKYIIIMIAILTLSGCASYVQRQSECYEKYPSPPNTHWLSYADNQIDPLKTFVGYLIADAVGDDQQAYDIWKTNVNACIDQKTASQ